MTNYNLAKPLHYSINKSWFNATNSKPYLKLSKCNNDHVHHVILSYVSDAWNVANHQ